MSLSISLPRFIITINDRFLLRSNGVDHPFGVSGFARLLVNELRGRGLLLGIILYRRDALCSEPLLWDFEDSGMKFVQFRFSFATSRVVLSQRFKDAVGLLRRSFPQDTCPVVVYHQTPILVPFTPDGQPFVVTHHGPFAQQILSHFGREVAAAAFEGESTKLDHLLKTQKEGLEFLRARRDGCSLELSVLQAEVIRSFGIPSERVDICPPSFYRDLSSIPRKHGPRATGCVHLISAAARVDSFKHFRLLVEAANLLHQSSLEVVIEIYAGNESHRTAREELLCSLLPAIRERSTIAPCLTHDLLIDRFIDSSRQSIFVLTSIYETFGITALESILTGNLTLVPDVRSRVGLTGMVAQSFRYSPTVNGLAGAISTIITEFSEISALGRRQQLDMQRQLREREFVDVLVDCALKVCLPEVASSGAEAKTNVDEVFLRSQTLSVR